MLSGLNLAFFTISKLDLQLEVNNGNKHARQVLTFGKDANFLLMTILWGNVAVNVLLALLTGSVLTGITAFLFSTVVITVFGEILPQADFPRNALKFGSFFSPVLRFYQALLFPVAKPTAMILDRCLGPEAISYFVDDDVILLWGEIRRIITGGDILGRLLRGIVQNPPVDRGTASNSNGAGT
jgi:CBS domain containing-hemolysin-like protein